MNNGLGLLLLILVPLVGGLVGALLPSAKAARSWALFISLATLSLGILLVGRFDFQFVIPGRRRTMRRRHRGW